MSERLCPKCRITKPLDEFYRRRQGPSAYCKPCQRIAGQEWRKTHPDTRTTEERMRNRDPKAHAARAKARYHRLKADPQWLAHKKHQYTKRYLAATYGLTVAEYESMLAAQGGVCAICREATARRLDVDHDHATGAVRGLLCNSCNVGLGRFSDDAGLLEQALAYVRAYEKTVREKSCLETPAA